MMSGSAIMMMVIGMVVIWGGLALSIANLFHKKTSVPKRYRCFFYEIIVLEKIPITILQLRGRVKE